MSEHKTFATIINKKSCLEKQHYRKTINTKNNVNKFNNKPG